MARLKGPYYDFIGPGGPVVRHVPRSLPEKPLPEVLEKERYHIHPDVFLARIPRARIYGPTGVVVTPDGGIVEESTWAGEWLERDPLLSSWRKHCEELPGSYYSIVSLFPEGYGHWVLDVLPRLHALDRIPDANARLIVHGPLNGFQSESLRLLNIDLDRCVFLDDRSLKLDVLYLPSYVGSPGNVHPIACRWLRSMLLGSQRLEKGTRRLYLTRRTAVRRRVVNEEQELEPVLISAGFEIIEPGELSFRDQVKLFSQAEIIVSPHSSALANIIFAPAGCRVLEIRDPIHRDCCFYALADALEQEYWYSTAARTHSGRESQTDWTMPSTATRAWDDLHVPTAEFERLLTAITRPRPMG